MYRKWEYEKTAQDVLKSGESEKGLTEEVYREIFNLASDAIIVQDAETFGIIDVNSRALDMFGYCLEEMQQLGMECFSPGEPPYTEVEFRHRALQAFSGGPQVYEGVAKDKKGSTFTVEFNVKYMPIGSKRFILTVVREIHQRKQMEREALMSAQVIDHVTQGIAVTDEKGMIIKTNPACCRILGCSESEMIGKSFWAIIDGQVCEETRWDGNVIGEVFRSSKMTLKRIKRSQEVSYIWVTINPIQNPVGKLTHYAAIMVDVTDHIRIAEQKQQLQEKSLQAQRVASLGAMSAGIVHEIAQPLNALSMLADGMLYWKSLRGCLDEEKAVQAFQAIMKQVGRIDHIINHVRGFAAMTAENGSGQCDINEAVAGALELVGAQLASRGITVSHQISSGLPMVQIHLRHLEQVIINLVINAMQALEEISGREKWVSIHAYRDQQSVVIEIKDNATGVSPVVLGQIFEPFFTTKDLNGGMGLGLSVVQNIISNSGGRVNVMNNDQGGATFCIHLSGMMRGDSPPST